MTKMNTKPVVASYYYGEVGYYADPVLHAR